MAALESAQDLATRMGIDLGTGECPNCDQVFFTRTAFAEHLQAEVQEDMAERESVALEAAAKAIVRWDVASGLVAMGLIVAAVIAALIIAS